MIKWDREKGEWGEVYVGGVKVDEFEQFKGGNGVMFVSHEPCALPSLLP